MKFLSQVYTAVSGSVGGLTYSHNRAGMYTRARATPVNPATTRQSAVRNALAAMVVYWHNDLTSAERAAWDTYAENTPLTDPLGQQQNVTGQNMFLRTNILRSRLALSIIDAAPTDFDLGQPVVSIEDISVAAGDITFEWTVGGSGTSDTGHKIVQIGVAQNAGRSFFRGPYQLAAYAATAAAATDIEMTVTLAGADWLAEYEPDVGDLLPVRIRYLYDDGRLTTPYRALVTVT